MHFESVGLPSNRRSCCCFVSTHFFFCCWFCLFSIFGCVYEAYQCYLSTTVVSLSKLNEMKRTIFQQRDIEDAACENFLQCRNEIPLTTTLILHSLDKKRSKPKKPKQSLSCFAWDWGRRQLKEQRTQWGCCHKDYLSSLWRVLCRSIVLSTQANLCGAFFADERYVSCYLPGSR